ncbi:hypothetical protein HBH74_069780 [Parastagonospora nodorum]|nr:hypothetical protein HBH74_069780 [Parastagonospora nodorum]KAH4975659.1 hypothetical protein HBH73_041270 [Parastagonospora nodorum]
MNSRHPNRPKRAAKHKSARKLLPRKPAASEAPAIAALDLPADIRALLYIDEEHLICIQYTHLEQYFAKPGRIMSHTSSKPPPREKPNVYVDIASHTPAKPALLSLNITPYIWLYLTFKHIRFHFFTENDHQGLGLADLASQVFSKHASSWRKHVLESGNVEEVRIWWRERSLDVVLKRGSDWAIEWDCHDKDSAQIVALKSSLGLIAFQPRQWRGSVVVASVEG